jgi:protein-tyrosine kinase
MSRLRQALERAGVREDPSPDTVSWAGDWTEPKAETPQALKAGPAVLEAEPPTIDVQKPPISWSAEEYRREPLSNQKIISDPNANPLFVEQYRRLAAALHQAQQRQGVKSVMVTSAVAAEGKTLTSVNLALTLSHSYQRRVLLIDADFRAPSIHGLLQLPHGAGLADVLREADGYLPMSKMSPNLSVLTAGSPLADPMSLLVSSAMRALVKSAAADFDWVVIDTPPLAFLSDANLLSAMVDAAVLVVKVASTPYPLARRAIEAVGVDRVLGVVLNRTKLSDAERDFGYYAYAKGGPSSEPSGRGKAAHAR